MMTMILTMTTTMTMMISKSRPEHISGGRA
jgi:hypothetical protein